jgi:hypothetical protein
VKRVAAVLIVACAFLGCEKAAEVKAGEEVMLFPGSARFVADDSGGHWTVPVHGWIYEPKTDSVKRKALLAVLAKAFDLEEGEASTALFEERARPFLWDGVERRVLTLDVSGVQATLGSSDGAGHFRGTVNVPAAAMKGFQKAPSGRPTFAAVPGEIGQKKPVLVPVLLVPEEGVSVVSDIDDTIKISNVRDKKALVANTFLKEYEAVGGMAEWYKSMADRGAAFHYVSASPWHLYPALRGFADECGFPAGTYHLKELSLDSANALSLLSSPEKWKPEQI